MRVCCRYTSRISGLKIAVESVIFGSQKSTYSYACVSHYFVQVVLIPMTMPLFVLPNDVRVVPF